MLGRFKVTYATAKSYILHYDPASGKWPLYVNVQDTMTPEHAKIAAQLLHRIVADGLTKELAIALRGELIGRV